MPTPLDRALKRLAELQREIDEVTKFIELYQRFEGKVVDAGAQMTFFESIPQLIGNETAGGSNQAVDNSARKPRRNRPPGATPREIAEIMERVIRESGEPMSRGRIVDALERREIEIPAADKERYVGTIAWRNKGTFVNITGRGYWLRDSPQGVRNVAPGTTYSDPPEEHSDDLPEQ
jgi:hypothetical protein